MPKKDMGSVFGALSGNFYKRIAGIEKELGNGLEILVMDGLDGLYAIPLARRNNNKVDTYETEKAFLYGGHYNGFNIEYGLYEKLKVYGIENNLNIFEDDFYSKRVEKKYDFVYVNRSINYEKYKNIPMDRKLRKLSSSVKTNGYLFILYDIAIDEDDYEKYPKEQYLRRRQIYKYFKEDYDILFTREDIKLTSHCANPYYPFEHYHMIGYLIAKKRNKNIKKLGKFIFEFKVSPLAFDYEDWIERNS